MQTLQSPTPPGQARTCSSLRKSWIGVKPAYNNPINTQHQYENSTDHGVGHKKLQMCLKWLQQQIRVHACVT